MNAWLLYLKMYFFGWIFFIIHLPIICIINRWIFRVNESIELQKKVLKKLDALTDTVRETDPMLAPSESPKYVKT